MTRYVPYHCNKVQIHSNKFTTYITDSNNAKAGVHSTCLTWNVTRKHVVQLIPLLHAHNIARNQHKLHLRKCQFGQYIGHSCNVCIQPSHFH